MAVPKNKISRSRKHSRRANWKLTVPGLVTCQKCKELIMPHRVCDKCGFYKGVEVIKQEA